jgi:hypothetical protein
MEGIRMRKLEDGSRKEVTRNLEEWESEKGSEKGRSRREGRIKAICSHLG